MYPPSQGGERGARLNPTIVGDVRSPVRYLILSLRAATLLNRIKENDRISRARKPIRCPYRARTLSVPWTR